MRREGGPAGRTELIWTMVARTAYSDARMGLANAMAYFSILLSILMIAAFARAGQALDEPEYISAAQKAASPCMS